MSRSNWKGKFMSKQFLTTKKLIKNNIKTWSRNSTVSKNLLGKTLLVHNGKEFKKVFISRERIGFKLGVFSLTRSYNLKAKKINKSVRKLK